MRTAGVLQMDTPLPDGRILVRPQDFIGGGTVSFISNIETLVVTGAVTFPQAVVPGMLMRYGMSDDAQQQFGKATPSGGYQGAQAQAVTPTTPFTTPYGPTGRPPLTYAAVTGAVSLANPRPKGVKPLAATVAYSVTGGPLASFALVLNKAAFNVGVVPVVTTLINNVNQPLQNAQTQLVTTPIPANLQGWLSDPFDVLSVILSINAGAATISIYGVYIDVAFNYN